MWTGFSAIGIHSDTPLQCGMEGVGSKQWCFGVFSPLGEKKKEPNYAPCTSVHRHIPWKSKTNITNKKISTLNSLKFLL